MRLPLDAPVRLSLRERSVLFVCAPLAFALVGCGGSVATAPPPAAPTPVAATKLEAPKVKAAPGHLSRAEVDAVIQKNGPPWVLQRVVPEEVFREGKFVGWKILSMPKEWSTLDLQPGDVVTRVNGMQLERPENMWSAWTSLAVSSELKIAYERDGTPRELVLQIDGPAAAEIPASMRDDAPRPREPKKKGPPKTIVIGSGEAPTASGEDGE